jgi:hypothetical protein
MSLENSRPVTVILVPPAHNEQLTQLRQRKRDKPPQEKECRPLVGQMEVRPLALTGQPLTPVTCGTVT